MKWFITPQELRRLGVVGMNRRNAHMIAALNPRSRYPLVDDKLQTKEVAIAAGIAVQIANGTGLLGNVESIDAQAAQTALGPADRVAFVRGLALAPG